MLALLALPLLAAGVDPPVEAASIVVEAGPRQVFRGFGVSLGNWGREYQTLAPGDRSRMSSLLFGGLRLRTLRLWQNLDELGTDLARPSIADFRARYVDSGLLDDARREGVVEFLLAPDAMPPAMKVRRPGGPADFALRDDKIDDYAALIASFLARLRDEAGVTLSATGLQNEPNDLDRIAPAQMPALVRALRLALDARRLSSVRIIAPEAANVDSTFTDAADLLLADPLARRALSGLAFHSYGMAATADSALRVGPAGPGPNRLDSWMTEASDNGPEAPGDAPRAASLASRVLNDLNHRTTHWVHFLGVEVADPRDDSTRILAYTPRPFRLAIFHKYYYYRQLAHCVDPGSALRRCTRPDGASMTWTYGKKPPLYAAASSNPDGSLSIALSNFTAPAFTDDPSEPNSSMNGMRARTFDVTIRVAELSSVPSLTFSLRRSGPSLTDADEGRITLENGTATVRIGPLELVTLRSGPSKP